MDLGVMDQALWNTLKGRFLMADHTRIDDNFRCYLTNHFRPILLLFLPFYIFFPDPKTLLFLQSVSIALGAIPLYLLAKEKLKNELSCIFLICSYLLYPYIGNANLFEFHPNSLIPCFLLFFLSLVKNRLV
jgi:uncharacterized membrane protein